MATHYRQLDSAVLRDDTTRGRLLLTTRRRELLEALTAAGGRATLDDLPPTCRQGHAVATLHVMRKVGLVRFVETDGGKPGQARTTHNHAVGRIEITGRGRALLEGAPVPALLDGNAVPADDAGAVAQDASQAPAAPVMRGFAPADDDDVSPDQGDDSPVDGWYAAVVYAAAPQPVEDGPSDAYPLLAQLRVKQARHARLVALLREAADLADDDDTGLSLLAMTDGPGPLTAAEAEYVAYADAHPAEAPMG